MRTAVITTLTEQLYNEYAHLFFESFPYENLDLYVFLEDNDFEKSFLDAYPIIKIKLTKHLDFCQRAHANNRAPSGDFKKAGNFRHDAKRFCYKVYTMWQAVNNLDYDRILWLDADIKFYKPINEDWINDNLTTNGIMSYMGRFNNYSETGVLYFNLHHHKVKEYLDDVINVYETDDIWNWDNRVDCIVFDKIREQYEDNNYEFRNLGVDFKVPGGHIQAYLYGEWFDHLKGKRKFQGYSQEIKG